MPRFNIMNRLEEELLQIYDVPQSRFRIFSSGRLRTEQLVLELETHTKLVLLYNQENDNQENADYNRRMSFNHLTAAYLTLGMINDSHRWAKKNGRRKSAETQQLRKLITDNVRMLSEVNRELGSVKEEPLEEVDGDR